MKMFDMIQELQKQQTSAPSITSDELFDFGKFLEEEKEKERIAEESDVDEISEDEMPEKFVEMSMEEETVYETSDGHKLDPERSTWFPRRPITIPALHQNIHHTREAHQERIISWKYDEVKRLFAIKRRGGVIQYFRGRNELKSLPRW